MKYSVYIFLLVLVFSCSDNSVQETDSLLKGEPYGSITDSIQQQPMNAGLYYRRGVLLLENEQFNHAEKDFKKAWELKYDEQTALEVVNLLKRKNTD